MPQLQARRVNAPPGPARRCGSAPFFVRAAPEPRSAVAFCAFHPGLDEGDVLGWFTNAIETSYDLSMERLSADIDWKGLFETADGPLLGIASSDGDQRDFARKVAEDLGYGVTNAWA